MARRYPSRGILLGAVFALALVAFVPQAGADMETHGFKGVAYGEFTVAPDAGCPIGLRSTVDGVGRSTPMFLTSVTATHCTSDPPYGDVIGPILGGKMTFVAANGKNTLEATYTGTAEPFEFVEGATVIAHLDVTITAGTGRFEGASGKVRMTGRIPYLHLDAASLGITSWTGWLKY